MRHLSPLRYPGGKGVLANFIGLVLKKNDLVGGHYVEPYAGGAGVAMNLLYNDFVSHVHINDLDSSIYAFWHAVVEETENLCRLIRDTPITLKSWDIQRFVQKNPAQYSALEVGFSTLFLNRTNRSGILLGGMIGGRAQNGKWKINARFNKKDLIDRIEKIGRYQSRISLYNQDAMQFIECSLNKIPNRTLIYLDPPYYVKGYQLYKNHYDAKDHATLAKTVTHKLRHNWIVSYDNVREVRKLYENYRQKPYNITYSASKHISGSEILIFSDALRLPRVKEPTKANP